MAVVRLHGPKVQEKRLIEFQFILQRACYNAGQKSNRANNSLWLLLPVSLDTRSTKSVRKAWIQRNVQVRSRRTQRRVFDETPFKITNYENSKKN